MTLSGCVSMALDLANYSIIEDNELETDDAVVRVKVVQVGQNSFGARNVLPGDNFVSIATCLGGSANCIGSYIHCSTLAGYVYKVTPYGCSNHGRRMDFEGASNYWANIDADPNRKAAEADAVNKQIRDEKRDAEQYERQQSAYEIRKEEAVEQATAKLASFRHSLRAGSETNCGPVIEVKRNLVKISRAVANYGNEHWIRREELFPSGYGCRFHRGEYQPPQQ
jgi:hypothetical protein